MKGLKKLHCVLLLLGSAAMGCNGENTFPLDSGDRRYVRPRLSEARWRICCARPPKIVTSCPEPIGSRERALELLVVAGGACLDTAVLAIEKHSPEDLAAAYLIRAERNDDPVDLLRASKIAKGFNRALVLERLGLREEAFAAWDKVSRASSPWGEEARAWRDARRPDPQWSEERLRQALARRDRGAVGAMARAFPVDAALFFEASGLRDLGAARLMAEVLAEGGDPYPKAVVEALERPADRDALERGLEAYRARDYERAAALLERAGNPLHLAARYAGASQQFKKGAESLPQLDALALVTPARYSTLASRIHTLRANALEFQDRYLEAHTAYEEALRFAKADPTQIASVMSRRSANYVTIGSPERGFRDSLRALGLLPRVASLNESHQAYGNAAKAALALGYPDIALQYQNAAVGAMLKAVVTGLPRTKHHLAISLRVRAEIHAARNSLGAAEADLKQGSELAEAADVRELLPLLRMRLREVRGDVHLAGNPAGAVQAYGEAIGLAAEQDSTYRAVLHFKRAEARRRTGDRRAEEDVTTAFAILRDEARQLLDRRKRGAYEELWTAYFSRFETIRREAIERSISGGAPTEEAFVQDEQARAFEPMHLLLQSQSVPPGFQPIRTVADLNHALATLPEDTAILQYVVLPSKTYVWVLTRGKITIVQLRATRPQIDRWVAELTAAVRAKQRDPFTRVARAVYGDLFRPVLGKTGSASTLVIIPDGPMYGLPFAALRGTREEGFLIERRSIATAGSTSLYLYARARDAQFRGEGAPSVLLVGDPAFDPRSGLRPLPYALREVEELRHSHYPDAEVLTGAEATIDRFLNAAREATIVHFAGHAVTNPQTPPKSRLFLAPRKNDSGDLTAERLMQELAALERTRLVVLGACSTAAGQPVGPEGLAPLVRPLIAANVPAVVGTLWDVNDATSKALLVSLHCHYRHGDDVAVALRVAQLERLRNHDNPMTWAAFQVVGYAQSPYPRPVTLEETHNDGVCAQNSLQRPHGLHPQ